MNNKTILYFTDSYPYGMGEEWKTNELRVLSRHFDKIEVIPFHYGSNLVPIEPIIGIKYHAPLFGSIPNPRAWYKFLQIGKSKHLFFFINELRKIGIFNASKIKQWLGSSYTIIQLLNNSILKEKLINSTEPTIAYFFWGRKTAKIVPLIRNLSITSYVRLHGYDLYKHRHKTNYIPYQEEILKKANKILTISEDGKNYLRKEYPFLTDKILISRLGTTYAGTSKQSSDNSLTLFSCSSLVPVKRVKLIALALLHIKSVSIKWIHIGDGNLKDEILDLTEKFSSNINFKLTGWIDSKKVKLFYQDNQADLFINVSESEGVPVSIMEAMSASIPVLATNVGGVSEIVNNENGKLLNVNIKPQELANEICAFYNLPILKKLELREGAYNTFKQKYNAETNTLELVQMFKSTLQCL